MRKRISEKNILPNDNMYEEYVKLEGLFSIDKCIGKFNHFGQKMAPEFTLQQYLNDLEFTNWNLKGTSISLYNMREELGLSKEKINTEFNNDIFIDFIEFCLNCLYRIEATIKKYYGVVYVSDENIFSNILENCKFILEKLNYSIGIEEETSEIYVYTKDEVATAVVETNEDIADSLIEYRRHDMKGNLKRKEEVLCTLFKKLEPIEKKFKGTEFANLASDTTFLFNKTGIRHWLDQDKAANKAFAQMDESKLEEWYDKTYDLFLSCMIASSYLDIKKEINEIKRMDK